MSRREYHFFAQFFRACRILRAPLSVSIAAFLVYSIPLQTREVYRVLADDFWLKTWQLALGFSTLLFAGLLVWYCARRITLLQRRQELSEASFEGTLLRWMPRLLGALIPLGAAIGLYRASIDAQTTVAHMKSVTGRLAGKSNWPELREIENLIAGSPDRLLWGAIICLLLSVGLMMATILRTWRQDWKYEAPGEWIRGPGVVVFCVLLAVGCIAAFSFAPPSLPQAIGTLAIFNIFVAVVAVLTSALLIIGHRLKIPIFFLLFGWALLLGASDWNENHVVTLMQRDVDAAATTAYGPAYSLKDSFKLWYESRKDLAHFSDRNEPYPVLVIAAAGGGAYAAHYTAAFLARMQDRCPTFAQHIFAISGVSGGSMGAAVFASLVKAMANEQQEYGPCDFSSDARGPLEEKTHAIFAHDFLSPVVAAGLFPDFAQRFLPAAISQFDRAKAFDASLEMAWADVMGTTVPNTFREPFLDLWEPPAKDRAVPALILNTTEVANGYRMVLSPVSTRDLPSPKWSKLADFYEWVSASSDQPYQVDVKLSTAVGMSARFPIVLPAAVVEKGRDAAGKQTMRLVDGGYVESSAVETANDIIKRLQSYTGKAKPNIKLYLLVLMGYDGVEMPERGFGELSIPLRALVSTWNARAEQAFMRGYVDNCAALGSCFDIIEGNIARSRVENSVTPIFLNITDFSLPLTWQLTAASRSIISLHAGVARRCYHSDLRMVGWTDRIAGRSVADRIFLALRENNCNACFTQYKLADRSSHPNWGTLWPCDGARRPIVRR